MNKRSRKKMLVAVTAFALCLSLISAAPNPVQAQPMLQAAEAQAVGGSDGRCAQAWGLGLGLAAAALSPCGIVCLTLAWYDLALIGAYCD